MAACTAQDQPLGKDTHTHAHTTQHARLPDRDDKRTLAVLLFMLLVLKERSESSFI